MSVETHSGLADAALSYLELVMLVHVLVALDVLDASQTQSVELRPADRRELSFRFARNGHGEEIVAQRFDYLVGCLEEPRTVYSNSVWIPSAARAGLRQQLRNRTADWLPKLVDEGHTAMLIVAWDDASAML